MPKILKIVFWQPNISHHNVPMIRCLAQNYSLTLCVTQRMSGRRASMGWTEPDTSGIQVELIPDSQPEDLFIRLNGEDVVHIFSGTSAYKNIWKVFKYAIRVNAKIGFQAETRSWKGIGGWIRFGLSYWETIRIRKNVSFILAIGHRGVDWYSRIGYSKQQIFDWAYFPQQSQLDSNANIEGPVKFIYAGRLSQEKGIIQLVTRMLPLMQSQFELHILGGGPQESKLKQLIQGHQSFVLHPQVPIGEVPKVLSVMDYLILPSTGKDGWGAVINEALSLGIPCIVSDHAGAADLIRDERLGWTFDPANPSALDKILEYIIRDKRKPDHNQRMWIRQRAALFSPQSGASYFKEIISHVFEPGYERPVTPWKKNNEVINLHS